MLSCEWLCVNRSYKAQKSYAHTLQVPSLKSSTLSSLASLNSALLVSIVFKQLLHLNIVLSRMNYILNILSSILIKIVHIVMRSIFRFRLVIIFIFILYISLAFQNIIIRFTKNICELEFGHHPSYE